MNEYAPHLIAKFAEIRRQLLKGLAEHEAIGNVKDVARLNAQLIQAPYNLDEVVAQCERLQAHAQGSPDREPTVLDKVRGHD